MRFISHHDTMRLFQRALGRANIPVRFSQGFNPRPGIRIALPRPVGVASHDELLVIGLASEIDDDEVRERLGLQAPAGLRVLAVRRLAHTENTRPASAEYELGLDSGTSHVVKMAAEARMADHTIIVSRASVKSGVVKSIDIRPYLLSITVEGNRLRWVQAVTQEGTARIDEVLACLGLSARDLLHHVVRRKVAYDA